MPEHLVFLTGRLAAPRLKKVLAAISAPGFTYEIEELGIKVAALMTAEIIRRRLPGPITADRVILPGRFRGDLEALSVHYGVPFQRGPDDVADLPEFFGKSGPPRDLGRHDVTIFAEIVDAAALSVEAILERASEYRRAGADVVDLGCLPDTPFPHLEEAITALLADGFRVSVDSADLGELRRGAAAGAHYLLSLTEESLDLAREASAVPVLVPAQHGDLPSLLRAMDRLDDWGLPYLADPILDPIHFGFSDSLLRYAALRKARPDAQILMGTGNLTELTDADTSGITAVLMGIVSELGITNVLVVQVSPHCRRSILEHDAARRLMYAAREEASLPVGISRALLCLRDRKPIVNTASDIAETAAMIRDANFRIEVAEDGIHIYNKSGELKADDPFALFPDLAVADDGAHAFYLGYELARAEVAWRLGKRFVQDQPLDWGVAADRQSEDLLQLKKAGTTLNQRKNGGKSK